MSAPSSPDISAPDRGRILLGTTLAFGIAAFLVVSLRLGFRAMHRKLGISDYSIAAAVVVSIAHTTLDALGVLKYGYGRHSNDVPLSIRRAGTPLMIFWLGQIMFKLSIMFTKISLFFIYRDLFSLIDAPVIQITRLLNYITAIVVVGYYGSATVVSIFSCTPVTKAWKTSQPGTCINAHAFLYSTAICNIITSLLLISIPIPLLLRTKHHKAETTQLLFLVLLGFLDTASSIVRLALLNSSGARAKNDTTWTLIPSTTAASVEMNLAIIAASLVVMRPCLAWIYGLVFGRNDPEANSNSNGDSPPSDNTKLSNNKIIKMVDVRISNRSISQERMLAV